MNYLPQAFEIYQARLADDVVKMIKTLSKPVQKEVLFKLQHSGKKGGLASAEEWEEAKQRSLSEKAGAAEGMEDKERAVKAANLLREQRLARRRSKSPVSKGEDEAAAEVVEEEEGGEGEQVRFSFTLFRTVLSAMI